MKDYTSLFIASVIFTVYVILLNNNNLLFNKIKGKNHKYISSIL